MGLGQLGLPVVLRNNFAAIIFVLIVEGAVFMRCAFSPPSAPSLRAVALRGDAPSFVISAYAAPRGSERPPGPLSSAALPGFWPFASPPPPLSPTPRRRGPPGV